MGSVGSTGRQRYSSNHCQQKMELSGFVAHKRSALGGEGQLWQLTLAEV